MTARPLPHPARPWRRMLAGAIASLAAVGVLIAVERTLAVTGALRGGSVPQPGSYEIGFVQRPVLTLLHVLPGLLFMVLGPFQFLSRLRSRHWTLHGWSGRIFIATGLVAGGTALVLASVRAFGGPLEQAATALFAPFMLFSLVKAWSHIRRREVALHREWMIRAFAIGLAVATMRPLGGLAMLATGRPLEDVLGAVFWAAFLLHALVAEAWIRRSRRVAVRVSR